MTRARSRARSLEATCRAFRHATSAARYFEECLPKAQYWDALPEAQTAETAPKRLLEFLAHAAQAA